MWMDFLVYHICNPLFTKEFFSQTYILILHKKDDNFFEYLSILWIGCKRIKKYLYDNSTEYTLYKSGFHDNKIKKKWVIVINMYDNIPRNFDSLDKYDKSVLVREICMKELNYIVQSYNTLFRHALKEDFRFIQV